MSFIAIALNLLLAGLLTAALVLGMRLNRRLRTLRESHEGFAKAVAELNAAAGRAEHGLAQLRAATDEAMDELGDRIERGRALALRLEKLLQQKPSAAVETVREPPAAVERRLGALLAAARDARARSQAPQAPEEEPLELRRPLAASARPQPADDDLFEGPSRPPLAAIAGGRR